MRLYGLQVLALLVCSVLAKRGDPFHECKSREPADEEACARPVEDVVAIRPGAFYTASILCENCPYTEWTGVGKNKELKKSHGDNLLFMNVTLSHDNRTVYLNDEPVFPKLRTIPRPPKVFVHQFRPDFSYRNLSYGLGCRDPSCIIPLYKTITYDCVEWCYDLQMDMITIDYLFVTKLTSFEAEKDTNTKYWEFAVDVIRGHPAYDEDNPKWTFKKSVKKMLKVVVAGTETNDKGRKGVQAPSSLFGPYGEDDKIYDYQILDVKLVDREYDFPEDRSLTMWQKISRFFGNDVWQSEGRLVYLEEQWGTFGKHGTLRNAFGEFIHWDYWWLFWIVFGSTTCGIFVIFTTYKLFFWIQAQRELMKWNGIDDVWDKLRREREEEESALLRDGYRDDPDEGSSSRNGAYTDDVDTMKPLPVKPLPEKPLPDVPLIDA